MSRNHQNKQVKLPTNLAIAGLIHVYIGWGFIWLFPIAVKHLAYNAYMGLIIGFLLILPLIWILTDFARIFPQENITHIFTRVLGKYLGPVFSLLFIFGVIIRISFAAQGSQSMVLTYFFIRTPQFLVTSIFGAISLYLAWHGIKSITRMAAFMLIPPLIVIFSLSLVGMKDVQLVNLQPVLAGAAKDWLAAGFDLLYIFIPVVITFFYLPFLQGPKQALKVGLWPYIVVVPLFLLTIIGTIGTFGPTVVQKTVWATIEFFHIIDMPSLLLEQAGLFFLLAWYAFFFLGVTQGVFFTSQELYHLWPVLKERWYLLLVGLSVFSVAGLPINIISLTAIANRFGHFLGIMSYALLVLVWIVARIRFPHSKTSPK